MDSRVQCKERRHNRPCSRSNIVILLLLYHLMHVGFLMQHGLNQLEWVKKVHHTFITWFKFITMIYGTDSVLWNIFLTFKLLVARNIMMDKNNVMFEALWYFKFFVRPAWFPLQWVQYKRHFTMKYPNTHISAYIRIARSRYGQGVCA